MGVSCQILITRPPGGVHRAGQPVAGSIRYYIDKPTEYRSIQFALVGRGKCSWTETSRTGNQRKSILYCGTETYTEQEIQMHSGNAGMNIALPPGAYEYPFHFLLPPDIPSSYADSTCTINYELILNFVKPNFFNMNSKFKTEVVVSGYVSGPISDTPVIFGLEKTLLKLFAKKKPTVHLKAEIATVLINPGGKVNLSFVVTNDTDVIIPAIKTELLCYTTYTANCGRTKTNTATIKNCTVETPSVPDNAVANMTSTASVSPHLFSIHNSKVITKEYRIKVTVRLPLPHLNASVEIPIVIGDIQDEDAPCASAPLEEAFEVGELPPTYWEAMNKDKGND